jgi:hypothetical protein
MYLQHSSARADDLPTFASSVARSTDRSEAAFGSRQGRITGQRPLPCGLAGRIDVKDNAAPPLSVVDAAHALRCPAVGEALLFEERAERFHTRAIDSGQEATQRGAMRKRSASKQSHEGRFERGNALKEVRQGPFPANGIAHQRSKKIDGLIAT